MYFATAYAERVRITSAGHLGSPGENGPNTRLSVTAASGTDVVAKFTSTDANAWIQFKDNSTTDTAVMVGASGINLLLRAGSNTRVHIGSDGKMSLGTSIHQSPSANCIIINDTNNMLMLDNSTSSTQRYCFAQNGATHLTNMNLCEWCIDN